MRLHILGDNPDARFPNYRGVDRNHPYFRDKFDEAHPVNQTFFQYIEARDSLGTLHNMDVAVRTVEIFHRYDASQTFEIVEIITGKYDPSLKGVFLGYDVSSVLHLSLLSTGLNFCGQDEGLNSSESNLFRITHPLFCLIERYFQPKLNANLLFDEYEEAVFFLECASAIEKLAPNAFDNPNLYEVIGLIKR